MRVKRNDDPRMKQRKCRKRLRREFAQCIERIPSGPPIILSGESSDSGPKQKVVMLLAGEEVGVRWEKPLASSLKEFERNFGN